MIDLASQPIQRLLEALRSEQGARWAADGPDFDYFGFRTDSERPLWSEITSPLRRNELLDYADERSRRGPILHNDFLLAALEESMRRAEGQPHRAGGARYPYARIKQLVHCIETHRLIGVRKPLTLTGPGLSAWEEITSPSLRSLLEEYVEILEEEGLNEAAERFFRAAIAESERRDNGRDGDSGDRGQDCPPQRTSGPLNR